MDDLPFDTIVVGFGAEQRRMTVREFLELPLTERIGHILGRSITFFNGDTRVDEKKALACLRIASGRP